MMPVAETPSPSTNQSLSAGPVARGAGATLARGKVLEARAGLVIFQPRGTNYELHLETTGEYGGPINKPTHGVVHVKARKVYTVPSGGNFIAPILGTPRTIQGRVVSVKPSQLVIQAGAPVVVDLPAEAHAIDLGHGVIEEGAIVNVVALPGARFEPEAA